MVPKPAFRSAVVCLPLLAVLLATVPQPAPVSAHEKAARELFHDGRFSAGRYTVSAFDPGDFDEDIVWADGYFARWPERK